MQNSPTTNDTSSQVLGIDPGDSTGWAVLQNPGGHKIASGVISHQEFPSWITKFQGLYGPTNTVVVEDFRLFGHKAMQQIGSQFLTVRVIGMIELWAYQSDVEIVYQSPTIKKQAEKFTLVVPKGAHKFSHDIDAYNHAAYWLHRQGRYKMPALT